MVGFKLENDLGVKVIKELPDDAEAGSEGTSESELWAEVCRGWEVGEPITLPSWDLLKPKTRAQAMSYIRQLQPNLIVLAWPCAKWSPLQAFGVGTRSPEYLAPCS